MQSFGTEAIPTEPLQTGTMYRNKSPIQFITTILMGVGLLQVIAIATAQPTPSIATGKH